MYQTKTFFLLLLSAAVLVAQTQTVNLRGTVSNSANKPISGAVVTISSLHLSDTTTANGSYAITATGVSGSSLPTPQKKLISLEKGILSFSLPTASPVMVEIFNVKGTLLQRVVTPNALAGLYRFNVAEKTNSTELLLINAFIGNEGLSFRYLPLHNGKYATSQSVLTGTPLRSRLEKVAAVNDTLKITAKNYKDTAIVITSYDLALNVTLNAITGTGGAKPSSGCGKTPPFSGEKRVTINVTAASAGNRDYILRLPEDYDKDHPYPLFFANHCMSGSADNVAHSEPDTRAEYEYYGMWKLANPKGGKGTTVFCAPEGINAGWGQGAKDLAFFRAMIKKFEEELCIDQSRIFAMGFSMGGSMSYALSCAMPDTMRAIGMLSGGNMSGCDGSHRGPVPIFIAHGTQDGRCTWPNFGWTQIKDLAERDGCDPIDIPALVNQNPPADQMHPVCFEYKNCKEGFPCRACIFKGDHIGSPGTQGSYGKNNTWTDDSAWSYFKRFY